MPDRQSNEREPLRATAFGTRWNPPPRGRFDRFVRRFGMLTHVAAVLGLYVLAALAIGLAVAPALWFVDALWRPLIVDLAPGLRHLAHGVGIGVAFFIAGFALLLAVAALNFVLPTRVRPFVGGYFSSAAVPWGLHNGLFYVARYTFLPFVTLTPFGPWFLRAMGMRIGRGAYVNTEFISDPRLIRIGDDCVIGGSVHLFAHHGGGGHLSIAPVVIGDRVTIGQMATVMGDASIGDDAVVLPHSVVLPGTRIGAGELWGGVPARRMSHEEVHALRGADDAAARGEPRRG
jgi:acetyltransferase-like isoleucine patch superfamily enzyme